MYNVMVKVSDIEVKCIASFSHEKEAEDYLYGYNMTAISPAFIAYGRYGEV